MFKAQSSSDFICCIPLTESKRFSDEFCSFHFSSPWKRKVISIHFFNSICYHSFFFLQPADAANYLSYESYPVLCRDAAATYLPPNEVELSKKYICKQTFDCCRKCNHMFYTCSGDKHDKQPFGACIRAAYKCMCYCIDEKSNEELPYKKEAE